jgi:hypothetical protein
VTLPTEEKPALEQSGINGTTGDKGKKMLRIIGLPEFLFVLILILIYFGDHILKVWTFIYGYRGFAEGVSVSPILPFTFFMIGASFTAIIMVLIMSGARLWRAFLVAISTPIAAVWFFEFVWDLVFLIRSGNFDSWFGFPGPIIYYYYAFLSLAALWFVGIRYWKFSVVPVILWVVWFIIFAVWDFTGYPQSGFTFVVNYPYIINVLAKVMTFIVFASPVVSWGNTKLGTKGIFRSSEAII